MDCRAFPSTTSFAHKLERNETMTSLSLRTRSRDRSFGPHHRCRRGRDGDAGLGSRLAPRIRRTRFRLRWRGTRPRSGGRGVGCRCGRQYVCLSRLRLHIRTAGLCRAVLRAGLRLLRLRVLTLCRAGSPRGSRYLAYRQQSRSGMSLKAQQSYHPRNRPRFDKLFEHLCRAFGIKHLVFSQPCLDSVQSGIDERRQGPS